MKKRKGGLVFFHNIEDNVFQNKKICNNNTAIITLSQPFTIMYAQTKKKTQKMCVLNMLVNTRFKSSCAPVYLTLRPRRYFCRAIPGVYRIFG